MFLIQFQLMLYQIMQNFKQFNISLKQNNNEKVIQHVQFRCFTLNDTFKIYH